MCKEILQREPWICNLKSLQVEHSINLLKLHHNQMNNLFEKFSYNISQIGYVTMCVMSFKQNTDLSDIDVI